MPPTLHPSPLPGAIRRDPRFSAEVQVYDSLAASLPGEYAGYHGVAWLARKPGGGARDGEADFVIAHPERGVPVLEVKGGTEIRYEAEPGKWYSRDAAGEYHTIKNPFNQARENKYALREKLLDVPALKGRRLPMAHGVIFPGYSRSGWRWPRTPRRRS